MRDRELFSQQTFWIDMAGKAQAENEGSVPLSVAVCYPSKSTHTIPGSPLSGMQPSINVIESTCAFSAAPCQNCLLWKSAVCSETLEKKQLNSRFFLNVGFISFGNLAICFFKHRNAFSCPSLPALQPEKTVSLEEEEALLDSLELGVIAMLVSVSVFHHGISEGVKVLYEALTFAK